MSSKNEKLKIDYNQDEEDNFHHTTKKEDDENDWDLLLDPFEDQLDIGRKEGREAGLNAGFRDGYKIGKLKALEIGIELGYMTSIATLMLQQIDGNIDNCNFDNDHSNDGNDNYGADDADGDNDNKKKDCNNNNNEEDVRFRNLKNMERKKKVLNQLLDAINTFPTPDQLFSKDSATNNSHSVKNSHVTHGNDYIDVGTEGSKKDDIEEDKKQQQQQRREPMNIVHDMQRIRAKFKTILVLMKMPNLTLKKVMDVNRDDNLDKINHLDTMFAKMGCTDDGHDDDDNNKVHVKIQSSNMEVNSNFKMNVDSTKSTTLANLVDAHDW